MSKIQNKQPYRRAHTHENKIYIITYKHTYTQKEKKDKR